MSHEKYFKDLRFYVVATPSEYHVDYSIYDVESEEQDGTPLFHRRGSARHPDVVKSLQEAEPYLHGSVKWDGCSNWHFDEQDRLMLHACDREGVVRFGEAMARCWDWTADLCSNWND